MKLRTNILILVIFNLLFILLLYLIPEDLELLEHLCLFKNIFGKPCWNCGMTRAFLAVIHLNFGKAYELNHNVVIILPLSIVNYLYTLYEFIRKG